MSYTEFDNTKPDGAVDNGAVTLTAIRDNLQAMSDAVMMGVMPGWNMLVAGGTAEQPAEVYFTNSPQIIKAALVWGTSGGSDGNVTQMIFYYSADGIANDVIGTVVITYDTDGNATATNWS